VKLTKLLLINLTYVVTKNYGDFKAEWWREVIVQLIDTSITAQHFFASLNLQLMKVNENNVL
jgi:hypothetical protein